MNHSHVALGEVADFVNGAAFKPEDWGEDGLPIIRIQNLTDSGKTFNYTERVVPEKLVVNPGDLLVSWSATLGVFRWNGPRGLLNQHIFRVLPNDEVVDKNYLRHALGQAINDMERHLHGATMKHVNRGEFLGTRIPLPPLKEQRRIAAILDKANRLAELRKRSVNTINLLKQATFRRAIANRAIYSTDEPYVPLGDCLSFITSGGRGWSQYYADKGSRFIRSGDVQMNKIIRSDPQYVQPPDNAEAKRTCVRDGDVLLTITGSRIGRVAPASSEDSGAFISQHVAIVRLDNTKLIPSFASFFLSMPEGGQVQIKRSQYGQTKPGLNFEQIQKFPIPKLSLDKQVQVMSEIMAIDKLLQANSKHANKIDEYLASASDLAFRSRNSI